MNVNLYLCLLLSRNKWNRKILTYANISLLQKNGISRIRVTMTSNVSIPSGSVEYHYDRSCKGTAGA